MRLEDQTYESIERVQNADSRDVILHELDAYFSGFGFDTFIVSHLPQPGSPEKPFVLLSGWCDEWSDRYFGHNYVRIDPVARNCYRTSNPFMWSQAVYDRVNDRLAHKVMTEAADFGMKEGMCVPIATVDGLTGCVSMAGESPELPENASYMVHLLAIYAHGRLRYLDRESRPSFTRLSAREKEVLTWAAHGKTNQDIAEIMGISERTVLHHFQRIARKLSTVNRTHTVAQACLHNLIQV